MLTSLAQSCFCRHSIPLEQLSNQRNGDSLCFFFLRSANTARSPRAHVAQIQVHFEAASYLSSKWQEWHHLCSGLSAHRRSVSPSTDKCGLMSQASVHVAVGARSCKTHCQPQHTATQGAQLKGFVWQKSEMNRTSPLHSGVTCILALWGEISFGIMSSRAANNHACLYSLQKEERR